MNPITHFLLGWSLAQVIPSEKSTPRDRMLITVAGVIPDLDGLGIVAEVATRDLRHPLTWWTDYHHVLGHNIGFCLLVTAVAFGLARCRTMTAVLVFVSFHLHLVGDVVGARGPDGDAWPIPYLMPFSSQLQLTWSGQWPLNGWQNVLITGGLIALVVRMAVVRGYSFLEMISKKCDLVVVETIRKRLGKEGKG